MVEICNNAGCHELRPRGVLQPMLLRSVRKIGVSQSLLSFGEDARTRGYLATLLDLLPPAGERAVCRRLTSMDDVKKKVLLDLFAAPSTVIPIVGGLSSWMMSWAMDGSVLFSTAGLVGVLGGLGMLATRLIFGLEKITEDAYAYQNDQQRSRQEAALDALDNKLRRDHDPRTQSCLRQLRQLYASFQADVRQGKISGAAQQVLEKVARLFQVAIQHLEHSYELWQTAQRVSGDARHSVMAKRDAVIQEVETTVEHLGKMIGQFHTFKVKANESELAKLRAELDETIRVAKRTEERIAAMGEQGEWSDGITE